MAVDDVTSVRGHALVRRRHPQALVEIRVEIEPHRLGRPGFRARRQQHMYNIIQPQMPTVKPKVFMGILSTLFAVLATLETGRSPPVARMDQPRWEQREMITTPLIDRSETEVFATSPGPWWPCALKRTRTNGLEGRLVRRGSRKAHPSHLPAHADASAFSPEACPTRKCGASARSGAMRRGRDGAFLRGYRAKVQVRFAQVAMGKSEMKFQRVVLGTRRHPRDALSLRGKRWRVGGPGSSAVGGSWPWEGPLAEGW
jgi:hypothetical protein